MERKFQRKKQVVPGEHDVKIYMRMASLAGFGWTIGFILFLLPDGQQGFQLYLSAIFKYLFILLNSTPGIFIFAVYVCNRRVVGLYWQLFGRIWAFFRDHLRLYGEYLGNFRHLCVARTKHRFQKFHQYVYHDRKDELSITTMTTLSPVDKFPNSMLWMDPLFVEHNRSKSMNAFHSPEEQQNDED